MNVLALEVSTSSAKAMIFSMDKGIRGVMSIPYDHRVCDVVSQDPHGIYLAIIECAKALIEREGCAIHAIGVGSTWHSLLFLDRERKPMGRIKTWANTQAANIAGEYRKDQELTQWLYQRTGCMVHSLYPLWKYIYANKEQTWELDPKGFLSSQPEYIFEKMTGEKGVSLSVASGTGFMNIGSLEWDQEILDFAGIKEEQLSPLYELGYTAPLKSEVARELGLKTGTPVAIPGPDGALNQVGAGALGKGLMTMSVGTSGALRIASQTPVLPQNPSTWCYYVAHGKWLAGAATSGAGNCIEWFLQKANQGKLDYDILDDLAGKVNKEDAPIFLPFLYGERCPGWQDTRAGGYFQLKGHHEIGHLYYSILEGILFNLYQCYIILSQLGGVPSQIRISGGIENSRRWLQMAADIFQKKIYTSRVEHASTMGAVAVALKAVDAIESLEAFNPGIGDDITPDGSMAESYKSRFKRYIEWYEKTSGKDE
jgi:gluconokinase